MTVGVQEFIADDLDTMDACPAAGSDTGGCKAGCGASRVFTCTDTSLSILQEEKRLTQKQQWIRRPRRSPSGDPWHRLNCRSTAARRVARLPAVWTAGWNVRRCTLANLLQLTTSRWLLLHGDLCLQP